MSRIGDTGGDDDAMARGGVVRCLMGDPGATWKDALMVRWRTSVSYMLLRSVDPVNCASVNSSKLHQDMIYTRARTI